MEHHARNAFAALDVLGCHATPYEKDAHDRVLFGTYRVGPVSRGPGTKASLFRQTVNMDVVTSLLRRKSVYTLSPQYGLSVTSIPGSQTSSQTRLLLHAGQPSHIVHTLSIGLATHYFWSSGLHQTPTDPYTVGKRAVGSCQPCTRLPHAQSQTREKMIDAHTFLGARTGRRVTQLATCAAPPEPPEMRGRCA